MKRPAFARPAALLLAAFLFLLPSLSAPAEEAPAGAEASEADPAAVVEGEAAAEAESMPGEVDGLSLWDMDAPPATPEPTPIPTVGPTNTPNVIPWLSSRNYPDGKVSFEDEIWTTLTGKWGLTDFQAAGLMSSIQAESAFCPYNAEGMNGSDDRGKYRFSTGDSVGFGLCQWTTSGRKEALRRYAAKHGSGDLVWDFDIQMGFMAGEIDVDFLRAAGSLYEVAEWMVLRYERPNLRYTNSWPGTRYEKGLEIYRRHAGRDYDEPPLAFSAAFDGADALAGGVTLRAGEPAVLTVNSNYYWRLTQQDAAPGDWLDIRCAQVYHPNATEPCVCGYAADGDKALTLTARLPEGAFGRFRTTLRFEVYRGGRQIIEVPVTLTAWPWDALSALPEIAPVPTAAALFAVLMTVAGGE